jgi:hypothetical protein
VQLAEGGVFIWGEAELAVAGDFDGDLEDFWGGVSWVVICELRARYERGWRAMNGILFRVT